MTEAVLGPPGTGKTKYLIDVAAHAINYEQIPRDRVGFITYTKKAAEEGRSRMGVGRGAMPWVGTIHSFVWKCIDANKWNILVDHSNGVVGSAVRRSFDAVLMERLGHSFEGEVGRAVRALYSLSRSATMGYDQLVDRSIWHRPLCTREQFEAFDIHYNELKAKCDLMDFDDMLDRFLEEGRVPELDLLLVDEAQDLTAKLWQVVERIGASAKRVYLAGDDDQMLYWWMGADDGRFQRYFQDAKVLSQSHRCSRAVAAKANHVIQPVQTLPKIWHPTDQEGKTVWTTDLSDVPLRDGRKWLVLCRTNRRVNKMARELKERRIYYSTVKHGVSERGYTKWMAKLLKWWKQQPFVTELQDEWALKKCLILKELRDVPKDLGALLQMTYERSPLISLEDMAYARDLHGLGEDVLVEPKVVVMTINQAKGLEADCVLIDMHASKASRDEWEHSLAPETRNAYVAVTRAREEVWFLDDGFGLECYRWGE